MYRRLVNYKNIPWYTVTVISADEYITYGSGRRKVVFTAEFKYTESECSKDAAQTRQCIYWGNIKLNAGDKPQIQGIRLDSGIFLCKKLLLFERAENSSAEQGKEA